MILFTVGVEHAWIVRDHHHHHHLESDHPSIENCRTKDHWHGHAHTSVHAGTNVIACTCAYKFGLCGWRDGNGRRSFLMMRCCLSRLWYKHNGPHCLGWQNLLDIIWTSLTSIIHRKSVIANTVLDIFGLFCLCVAPKHWACVYTPQDIRYISKGSHDSHKFT